MSKSQETPKIPLPKGRKKQVRSAVLHVISLAQFTAAYTRGWSANSINSRIWLKAERDRANQQVALLREQIRITSAASRAACNSRTPGPPKIVLTCIDMRTREIR